MKRNWFWILCLFLIFRVAACSGPVVAQPLHPPVGYEISKTAKANAVPLSDVSGKISSGWFPDLSGTYIPLSQKAAASGVASLDVSSKVVQDPANATATPTASKIPIADGSGKLDGWVSAASGSTAGLLTPASPTEAGGTTPNVVHSRKPMKTVSTTPVTLTLPEIANGYVQITTGASVIVLPSADATYDGACVKFRSIAAVAFSVDNTAQITELNGTALDAGDKVTMSGVSGEEISFTWDNTASRWRTSEINGVAIDGGA